MQAIICPSMLSCDFAKLGDEAKRMVDAGADWLHIDVMDGHFVPNLTLGAPIVKCMRPYTQAIFDCHLMVTDPAKWVDEFAKAGANVFTFHIEAASGNEATTLCDTIRAKGMKCGVALRPATDVDAVLPLLDEGKIDMVLVMSVEPGFGGQSFLPETMTKVSRLRKLYPTLDIEVDGGVNVATIEQCTKAGANVIVSGSGVFKHASPSEAIAIMRKSVETNVLKRHTAASNEKENKHL